MEYSVLFFSHSAEQKSNHLKGVWLFFISVLFTMLSAEEMQDTQFRLEAVPQWYSTESYVIQGPIGIERRNSAIDRDRVYIRPSASYAFDDSDWSAGIGLYLAYNLYDDLDNTIEIRPYLGLNYLQTYSGDYDQLSFNFHLRAEDRFRYDAHNWDKTQQNVRLRFKTSGIYDFHDSLKTKSWRRLILSGEILHTYLNDEEKEFHLNENFEVESRLSLGIERNLAEQKRIRLELSWRYQVPFNEISDATFHTFGLKISYYPVWGDILKNRLFRHIYD